MSLLILEKRREIEGNYKKLRNIRERIHHLLETNSGEKNLENLMFLEFEEESVLTNIVKIKTLY